MSIEQFVFYCVLIVWYHGFGWHARHTVHGVHPKRDRRKRYVVRRDSDESRTTIVAPLIATAVSWGQLKYTRSGTGRANYALQLTCYT